MNNSKSLSLPIGIHDFFKLRKSNYYYVDKTKLVEQVLDNSGKVTLITRPNKFGNSLNMSMLRYFLNIGTDITLFDNLYISTNKKVCEKHLGKHPAISLSFKNIDGKTFEIAKSQLTQLMLNEMNRYDFSKINYARCTINDFYLPFSLYDFSSYLYQYYGKNVVILIDDYNIPLVTSYKNGYYREMSSLMNGFLGSALKGNDYLDFALLIGCQSVIKGDDISGLNNIKTITITHSQFDDQFGFTEDEVKKILRDYQIEETFPKFNEWYGGYHIGSESNIFCPEDVMNYINLLIHDHNAEPKYFWYNDNHNTLIKQFLHFSNPSIQAEIEDLVHGESISKEISEYLTYEEMNSFRNYIWSTLFAYGYLTHYEIDKYGYYHLVIPNKKIKTIFENEIHLWFNNLVFSNPSKLKELYQYFLEGNSEQIEFYLNILLHRSMCVFDTEENDVSKEMMCHNFLYRILEANNEWTVRFNAESDDGLADIIVELNHPHSGIILKIKYVEEYKDMTEGSIKALSLTKEKQYTRHLITKHPHSIILYGITFCKKRCKVVAEKLYD